MWYRLTVRTPFTKRSLPERTQPTTSDYFPNATPTQLASKTSRWCINLPSLLFKLSFGLKQNGRHIEGPPLMRTPTNKKRSRRVQSQRLGFVPPRGPRGTWRLCGWSSHTEVGYKGSTGYMAVISTEGHTRDGAPDVSFALVDITTTTPFSSESDPPLGIHRRSGTSKTFFFGSTTNSRLNPTGGPR